LVFGIAAAVYVITSLPYLLFATAKQQPWNETFPKSLDSKHPEEQETLT